MAIDLIVMDLSEQPRLSLSREIETLKPWQVGYAKIAYAAMLHRGIHYASTYTYIHRSWIEEHG
jgi:hypothetical protein